MITINQRQQDFYDYLTVSADISFPCRVKYALMVGDLTERYLLESLDLWVPNQYLEVSE